MREKDRASPLPRPPTPMTPRLIRSLAPITRPVAAVFGSAATAGMAPVSVAPSPAVRFMNSLRFTERSVSDMCTSFLHTAAVSRLERETKRLHHNTASGQFHRAGGLQSRRGLVRREPARRLNPARTTLSRNFRFGLPGLIHHKPNRRPLILQVAFFPTGAVFGPARRGCHPARKVQDREILHFQCISQTLPLPHTLVTLISLCPSPPST